MSTPTDHFVIVGRSPAETRPLPDEESPLADPHSTQPLPPLTWKQRLSVTWCIGRDRAVRGWPFVLIGAGATVFALILLLVAGPAPAAQAVILARPPAPTMMITATPSLEESIAVAVTATPLPAPTEAPAPPAAQVVYVPPAPTAPPVDLVPAIVYVATLAEPTPSELTRIEPAGDGGQWIIVEEGNGKSTSTYVPPSAPEGLAQQAPQPTPYYGNLGGGGGSWGP